jgi:multiple sugar transport system permease protein
MGYAAALGLVLVGILLVFTLLRQQASKRAESFL